MPLPPQKVDEAFRTTRLNRVFGPGVANYIATSTTINMLPLDHNKSRDELLVLRDQLLRNYIQATLTVDRKKLILENVMGETKALRRDNANSDKHKETLKKRSILLTRRITQLKENVLKIKRINNIIRTFNDGSLLLSEGKFKEAFNDIGKDVPSQKFRRLDSGQTVVQVELQKNMELLHEINEQLIHDRDELIKEIEEIKESYGKNLSLFNEIVKIANGGEVLDEEIIDVDEDGIDEDIVVDEDIDVDQIAIDEEEIREHEQQLSDEDK